MTTEAPETLTSNSSASCGSIGSTQRCEIPALNPASARSWMASRDLGGKPLDLPAGALAREEEAVVQAVGASLPELDALGDHAVAAPLRRARRFVTVLFSHLLHRRFEDCSGGNPLALLRCPRGKARAQGPRGEIRVRLGGAHLFHRALDAHLALELRPLEHQPSRGPGRELARLAAAVP